MEAPWIFDGAFDPSQLIEAAADDMIDVWKKTQRRIHDHIQITNTMFIVYANCWLCQHNVTSRQVTAVSNAVLEAEILCHRYLNINNSTIK